MTNDELIAHAKKVAVCIHIAADAPAAKDVDQTIRALIKRIEELIARIKELTT